MLPREKHTERLVRILTNLDAGRTPFAVKSLHVFGSYARGALYPRDPKPNLWHAVWYLRHSKKLKRIAFVAHLIKDEPNEILIFEPGKNWRTEQMEQRERERTFGKK